MFKMSFWQKNTQPDLSVTGRSTSRHQRPPSGHRGRPHSASRGGSTKSHIFGISDTPRQDEPKKKPASGFQGNNVSVTSSSLHTTPEAPRPSSGHAPKKTAGSVANVRSILNKYFNNHYYSTIQHKYLTLFNILCHILNKYLTKLPCEIAQNYFQHCLIRYLANEVVG